MSKREDPCPFDFFGLSQFSPASQPKIESNNMLFCFDWDETIVKGSLDDYLRQVSPSTEHVDQFLEDKTKGWKNKEQLVELLKKILNSKCSIAIVSFGSYPKEIKYALTKLLEKSYADQIYVASHLPEEDEMDYMGKQRHIEEAQRYFKISMIIRKLF